MTRETLDIGCGPLPLGTVNLDLFLGYTPHHIDVIDGRAYPNFVQGDAQTLPFKDKAFQTVMIRHVLEHLPDVNKALREICRISYAAIITVPNNPVTWEHPQHLYSWSHTSFENLLKHYWNNVNVISYTRPSYPGKSRFYRLTQRFPIIGRYLARMLLYLMKLELEAYCTDPKEEYYG